MERGNPYSGLENPSSNNKQPSRSLHPLEMKLNNDEESKNKI
jgi:hypothetical protein